MQLQDSEQAKDSNINPQEAQKKLVEELKAEWKLMWSDRFNDKIKAEGVSITDYTALRVERGTIIHATKDFKALNFKEILQQHIIENPERFIQPNANEGGWHKFVKTEITCPKPKSKRVSSYIPVKPAVQQSKKGGRGWLHSV